MAEAAGRWLATAEEVTLPANPRARPWTQWWLDRSVLSKGLVVVAIPLLALVTVTGASLVLTQQERQERQIALTANLLISAGTAVLADAVDGETGVRGYAATGDPLFLAPYEAASSRLADDLTRLRSAATTQGQAGAAEDITSGVEAKFALMGRLRAATAAGASGAALVPTLKAGKSMMDEIRFRVASLVESPAVLVTHQRDAIARLEDAIRWVQLGGLLLGVLAGVAGIALFSSGISRRVKVARDNANRLGQGLAPVGTAVAADELGQLSRSLSAAHGLLITRESDLAAARDEAMRANQAKNTFLSHTSHELRTPLNAILGFAQLLDLSELEEDDKNSTSHILSAGRHLLTLINELIDTAQIEAGELRLSVEPVSVRQVADEVVTLIAPLAAARSITIDNQCAETDLTVLADYQRLRQVLINLMSNAVKYNRQGGSIVLGQCTVNDRDVELTVADTGPGLSIAEIDRIFVPFERLEAEQHGVEGTGIGLPLALALTEAMQGALEVRSTPGAGSVFAVRLPRAGFGHAADGEPAGAVIVPPSISRGAAPLIVLSIEDNQTNTEVLARFFRLRSDCTLYSAMTAAAGIEVAQQRSPDIILLDLHLPDLPGEEVFERLRADPTTATTPIVILSADATPATIARLLARGATGYLTKPVDLMELQDVLTTTRRRGTRPLEEPDPAISPRS